MGKDHPPSELQHHEAHEPGLGQIPDPLDPFKLEIDYSRFDERFENRPVRIGPEWTELDEQREDYIRLNALNYVSPVQIPKNIPLLDPIRRRKTPATRLWYRRVSSWERNGFFNVWTIKFNTKLRYLLFYPCLLWGVTSHVNQGWYEENYNHYNDYDHRVYDKLAIRPLPFNRVMSRPG